MNNRIINLSLVTKKCGCCSAEMISQLPNYLFEGIESQLDQITKQGIVFDSCAYTSLGDRVCATCNDTGKILYPCDICGDNKPYGKIQSNVGNRYFCTDCYGKVSAKEWDKIVYLVE